MSELGLGEGLSASPGRGRPRALRAPLRLRVRLPRIGVNELLAHVGPQGCLLRIDRHG